MFLADILNQDSTFEFEKRRNVPVRYDRELVQTTMKAMKRVAEIKKRREHMFWKQRYVYYVLALLERLFIILFLSCRMAAAREKSRAARTKKQLSRQTVSLVQPEEKEKVREKITVSTKRPSALIEGSGRSMGMEID